MEGKASYLIVACSLLMHLTVIGSDVVFFHTVNNDGILAYLTTQGVAYLLYPVLGWMADVYFTRYKFILLGAVTVIISTIAMILSAALFLAYQNDRGIFALGGVAIVIGLIGLGMFESTAIQFGMDQMPEASSRQLASFIQWYYWSCNVGQAVIMLCTLAILAYFTHCSVFMLNTTDPGRIYDSLHPYYFTICCAFAGLMAVVQLVCACIVLFLLICTKRHLIIDQAGKDKHPLKLIFKIVQYAWKHRCPERRSAFTYWEEDIPPRIDLGKSKYGGPFTTEEVEDTKTFFSILLLLFSLIGFHLSGHGYSLIDQLMRYQCPSHWIMLTLVDPMVFTVILVVFGIPLYQLTKLCSCKYHPNMLKRMGLGLVCCFLNDAIGIAIQTTMASPDLPKCHHFDNVTADSCYFLSSELNITGQCSTISNATNNYFYCEQNDTAFLLLLLPKLLQGFSFILVFMTALEFICAQAPLRLKGLLIGIWYALLAINYLFVEIPEIYTIHNITWKTFHSVKTFFILLSFLAFLCVSRCYNYRLRDEVVQEQYLVEEIYEREFDLAEQYEQEKCDVEESIIIHEALPEEKQKSYGSVKLS